MVHSTSLPWRQTRNAGAAKAAHPPHRELLPPCGRLPPKPKPTAKQLAAVALLGGGPRTLNELEDKGISRAVLDNLCAKGVLECSKVNKSIDLYSSIPLKNEPITLTQEQQAAYDALLPKLEDDAPHSALLYGVTGSGKTLVFLKLIERCLALGRRASCWCRRSA